MNDKQRRKTFDRLFNLWHKLLSQWHNLMIHAQTRGIVDVENVYLLRGALGETYQLLKPRLTLGNQVIIEKQYSIIVESAKIMDIKYDAGKHFSKLIELGQELRNVLNLLKA